MKGQVPYDILKHVDEMYLSIIFFQSCAQKIIVLPPNVFFAVVLKHQEAKVTLMDTTAVPRITIAPLGGEMPPGRGDMPQRNA